MKVKLSGFNVDADMLESAINGAGSLSQLTPETLSAAYARISRSDDSLADLRSRSCYEIKKARDTNSKVVFGMGHASISEHAVLSFDIEGISRLATEWLEHFRLASFTERSQRYVNLSSDWSVPNEISSLGYSDEFEELMRHQYFVYNSIMQNLVYNYSLFQPSSVNIENMAKEDARYVTSLSMLTNIGMTVNARTLENMILKSSTSGLDEIITLGKMLHDEALACIPSLIRYTTPSLHQSTVGDRISSMIDMPSIIMDRGKVDVDMALKYSIPKYHIDDKILSAIIMSNSSLSMTDSRCKVEHMSHDEKALFFKQVFKCRNMHESVLREFEHSSLTFELVISATAYAQLKRHRMTSQTTQNYNIKLGTKMPASIKALGAQFINAFNGTIAKSEALYNKLGGENVPCSNYVLTNSHKRRVLFTANIRELYHFSSLREDKHAQWDIRGIAHKMSEIIKHVAPLSSIMLCGKDSYEKVYSEVFDE